MFYVFESIDKNGSRKRIVYSRLRNALRHAWRYKSLPKIRRDANIITKKPWFNSKAWNYVAERKGCIEEENGDVSGMTRIERCQDCAALVEHETFGYFCDEFQKPCDGVINCPEWEVDPST